LEIKEELMGGKSSNRVTVKHVAQEAGVSTQTVSRVVNNDQAVLPGTRQRVQEVIDRLGYHPNAIARSLTQQKSCSMGVVASGLEYYGPSRTLVGIEQKANALGYSLTLGLLDQPDSDAVKPLIDMFLSRQVDGILWTTQEIGGNLQWLEHKHLPIPVVFTETQPREGIACVNVNSRLGGRLAVEHLLSQGYRHIGTITGPLTWWSARERLLGWREALSENRIAAGELQIVEGNWSTGSGARGLEQLIKQYPEMDAVFVGNDQMALGVLQTSRKLGLRIPEDLAIVGFDDIPEAEYFFPSLTTIRQDLMDFGGTAVELLRQLIDARFQENNVQAVSESQWLQPHIVIRDSSVRSS
jgi:LacI family transcriptional regulator